MRPLKLFANGSRVIGCAMEKYPQQVCNQEMEAAKLKIRLS
jgi:hypothetical protein